MRKEGGDLAGFFRAGLKGSLLGAPPVTDKKDAAKKRDKSVAELGIELPPPPTDFDMQLLFEAHVASLIAVLQVVRSSRFISISRFVQLDTSILIIKYNY